MDSQDSLGSLDEVRETEATSSDGEAEVIEQTNPRKKKRSLEDSPPSEDKPTAKKHKSRYCPAPREILTRSRARETGADLDAELGFADEDVANFALNDEYNDNWVEEDDDTADETAWEKNSIPECDVHGLEPMAFNWVAPSVIQKKQDRERAKNKLFAKIKEKQLGGSPKKILAEPTGETVIPAFFAPSENENILDYQYLDEPKQRTAARNLPMHGSDSDSDESSDEVEIIRPKSVPHPTRGQKKLVLSPPAKLTQSKLITAYPIIQNQTSMPAPRAPQNTAPAPHHGQSHCTCCNCLAARPAAPSVSTRVPQQQPIYYPYPPPHSHHPHQHPPHPAAYSYPGAYQHPPHPPPPGYPPQAYPQPYPHHNPAVATPYRPHVPQPTTVANKNLQAKPTASPPQNKNPFGIRTRGSAPPTPAANSRAAFSVTSAGPQRTKARPLQPSGR